MKISNPQITQSSEIIKLSVFVESEKLGVKELWFSVPIKYGDYLCKDRLDGFLVGMLFSAMQNGEDIHVLGCISEKLLFNLNNYAVPLILAFSSSCKKIKITAEETSSTPFEGKGIGTGFSGGIDSFSTIYDRFELERSPNNKINGLVFLNVGSHGNLDNENYLELHEQKFHERYEHLKKFPKEVGLEYIPVNSNLHSFHPWGHEKDSSLTMASGALMLQAHFRKYYSASAGWTYVEMFEFYELILDYDIAIFEPALLSLFSTESLEFIPDGWQFTRVEKTLRLMDYAPVRRYLNVCVSDEEEGSKNCSVCHKCCRTLMTLNSAGRLEDFKGIFDIGKYKRYAELKYACKQVVLRNKDPLARDNVAFARQNGIRLPSYPISVIICTPYLLSKALISTLKFLLPPSTLQRFKSFIRKSGKANTQELICHPQ